MPYQAGLIEDGVKDILLDRVDRIVFLIEEEGDTFGMPRKEGEVVPLLRCDPCGPEGPRGALYSFPVITDLKTAVALYHDSAQVSRSGCSVQYPRNGLSRVTFASFYVSRGLKSPTKTEVKVAFSFTEELHHVTLWRPLFVKRGLFGPTANDLYEIPRFCQRGPGGLSCFVVTHRVTRVIEDVHEQ